MCEYVKINKIRKKSFKQRRMQQIPQYMKKFRITYQSPLLTNSIVGK